MSCSAIGTNLRYRNQTDNGNGEYATLPWMQVLDLEVVVEAWRARTKTRLNNVLLIENTSGPRKFPTGYCDDDMKVRSGCGPVSFVFYPSIDSSSIKGSAGE